MGLNGFENKRKTVAKEKKTERLHYKIILALFAIAGAYYIFFEPRIIGHDNRYTLYVFLLPTLIGMLCLGIYRKHFLQRRLAAANTPFIKLFTACFYLIQGVIFSYFSLGLFSKIVFDRLNVWVASNQAVEYITCPVDRFFEGRRNSIDIIYQQRFLRIRVSEDVIAMYKAEAPHEYNIELSVRKGLWSYYLLDDWMIIKKS